MEKPMTTDSLIGKLEALRPNADAPELSELAYRQAVDDCIAIIRKHSAPDWEVVEDLLLAASRVYRKYGADSDWTEWEELKAAIAAMGESANQRIVPEPLTSETVIKGCEISDNKDTFDAVSARSQLTPEEYEILKRPIVQSLLYDLNLLPEQITTNKHWFYMLATIAHMDQAAVTKRRVKYVD